MTKPIALIILDGWGYREESNANAIAAAKKPFFDHLWETYPHSLLDASGNSVGLPQGQMGNSEVGHMTIGAGKVIRTDLVRINDTIDSGEFDENPAFISLFEHVKKFNSTLHVLGLLSNGGVHSHQNHLYAFLQLAKKMNVPRITIHAFMDGRDTSPQNGSEYLAKLENLLDELGPNFSIATISGRYYAMDRDNNWDRLALAEKAMFEGQGKICESKPSVYLAELYKNNVNDELLEPTVVAPTKSGSTIGKNDAVFFFNFRADRARMLSKNIIEKSEKENIEFVTMTEYSADFSCKTAFPPEKISTTLGAEISKAGFGQAHVAETEKFAHATYFLNGGREKPYEREKDILVESRKDVKTHDMAPTMRAEAVADEAIKAIESGTEFIFINFANADMVGHTANVPAIISAIECLDSQLKKVVETLSKRGGAALITADHGNAELNIDLKTHKPHTAHTTNLVPCILTKTGYKLQNGGLRDIAPTILTLMDLKVPDVMTGKSLFG